MRGYSLYLMRRKWRGWNQCRIGKATILSNRAGRERANAAWELLVGNALTVRVQEQFLSADYGIPQTVWTGTSLKDQDILNRIWEMHADNWDRGKVLLNRYGIDESHPVWRLPDKQYAKNLRQENGWATRRHIDMCKTVGTCQSPNSCFGALEVRI